MGEEKKEFLIHKRAIARLSPALDTLLNGSMREASEGRVCWPDVDADTFIRFACFAYSHDYEGAEAGPVEPEKKAAEPEGAATHHQTSKGKGRASSPAPAGDQVAAGPAAAPASNPASRGDSYGNWFPFPNSVGPASPRSGTVEICDVTPLSEFSRLESEAATVRGGRVSDEQRSHGPVLPSATHQPYHYGTEPSSYAVHGVGNEMPGVRPVQPYSVSKWLDMWKTAERRLEEDHAQYHLKKRRREYEPYQATYRGFHGDHHAGCGGCSDCNNTNYNGDDIHLLRRGAIREELQHRPQAPALPGLLTEPKSWIQEGSAKSKYTVMSSFSGMRGQITNHRGQSMSATTGLEQRMNEWRKSQLPVLLSHLKLYILADKYRVKDLGDLSLKRLHDCLLAYEVTRARLPDIIELTHMVFDNTVENDAARTMMVNFWLCFSEFVSSGPAFKDLIKKQGDFAASLLTSMATRIH